jgi:serine protease Do
MATERTSLLRIAGLGVAVLGVTAFIVVVAPIVKAQVKRASVFDFEQLSQRLIGGSAIGVEVRDADEADVKREKLTGTAGAVVAAVRSESPAAKAGIKAGDVILSFDGERVRGARHLERLVSETPAGRTVEAAIVRSGERMTVKIAVAETESPFKYFSSRSPGEFKQFEIGKLIRPEPFVLTSPTTTGLSRFLSNRGRLGVGVQDLTGQLGEFFGAADGVLVTAVDDGTPGKAAGLKAGDVITKINGVAVRDSNELRRTLAATSGETKITIVRDRKEQTLTAKIEDERASLFSGRARRR